MKKNVNFVRASFWFDRHNSGMTPMTRWLKLSEPVGRHSTIGCLPHSRTWENGCDEDELN